MLQKEPACVPSQAAAGKTTADMSTGSPCPPCTSPTHGHSLWWDLSLHPLISRMVEGLDPSLMCSRTWVQEHPRVWVWGDAVHPSNASALAALVGLNDLE